MEREFIEPFHLFRQVFVLRPVIALRAEPIGGAVLDPFLDALPLHLDQVENRFHGIIRFSEEFGVVLIPSQDSDLCEFHRDTLIVLEEEPDIRRPVPLNQFPFRRNDSDHAVRFAIFTASRN